MAICKRKWKMIVYEHNSRSYYNDRKGARFKISVHFLDLHRSNDVECNFVIFEGDIHYEVTNLDKNDVDIMFSNKIWNILLCRLCDQYWP